MKVKIVFPILLAVVLLLCACSEFKTFAYGDYETRVIGTELDGIYVVRVAGRSTKNDVPATARTRAMRQAEKRAVYDMTFLILNSNITNEKSLKPVLTEVNVRQKHQEYFDDFFADNGPWKKYMSNAGSRYTATKFYKTGTDVVCVMSVKVNRRGLIEKFRQDNIIK